MKDELERKGYKKINLNLEELKLSLNCAEYYNDKLGDEITKIKRLLGPLFEAAEEEKAKEDPEKKLRQIIDDMLKDMDNLSESLKSR